MRNFVNETAVKKLADKIYINYPELDQDSFCNKIIPNLDPLGLFERLDLVTKELHNFLPSDFKTTLNIITKSVTDGFLVCSLSNYISTYGIEYFDISMNALKEMTKVFSSEFAIRHFIIRYPDESIKLFKSWALDENEHVRRLVSEGLRPRLPWGIRLHQYVENPEPIIEFLNILRDDKELYVRRSVANNINDIAKDHPKVVIDTLKKWDKTEHSDWVIRHSLRTLVKQGNLDALEILGYSKDPKVQISSTQFSKDVILGGYLEFSFKLKSLAKKDQKLVIDYIVYHQKANGKKSPKVFKLKNLILKAGSDLVIKKRHGIKEISTRKYYTGEHSLEVKINGKETPFGEFNLQV
ncbi:MAG: hypothetical protein OCD02_12345 [Spirochaetaceae bacterium]